MIASGHKGKDLEERRKFVREEGQKNQSAFLKQNKWGSLVTE